MLLTHAAPVAPRVSAAGGRVVVDVAWRDAEALRAHFRKHGVGSTVHYEPWDRTAQLELFDAGPDSVRTILSTWH